MINVAVCTSMNLYYLRRTSLPRPGIWLMLPPKVILLLQATEICSSDLLYCPAITIAQHGAGHLNLKTKGGFPRN